MMPPSKQEEPKKQSKILIRSRRARMRLNSTYLAKTIAKSRRNRERRNNKKKPLKDSPSITWSRKTRRVGRVDRAGREALINRFSSEWNKGRKRRRINWSSKDLIIVEWPNLTWRKWGSWSCIRTRLRGRTCRWIDGLVLRFRISIRGRMTRRGKRSSTRNYILTILVSMSRYRSFMCSTRSFGAVSRTTSSSWWNTSCPRESTKQFSICTMAELRSVRTSTFMAVSLKGTSSWDCCTEVIKR